MTKRFGFTLAEVLITLGIIGVVAAMTIPTLISNTNEFKSAYKKALSTLNQAVLMNVAMNDTDFSTVVADDADSGVKMSDILTEHLQSATEDPTYFTSTEKNTKGLPATDIGYDITCDAVADEGETTYEPPEDAPSGLTCDDTTGKAHFTKLTSATTTEYKVYNLADGTTFIYNINAEKCTDESALDNDCYGFIDVNGGTNPNTIIACDDATADTCEVSNLRKSRFVRLLQLSNIELISVTLLVLKLLKFKLARPLQRKNI